jgi:hypothetical protein
MAIVKINPLRVGLFIDAELFASLICIEPETASKVDMDATDKSGRPDVHQLVVDDFPGALEPLFVPDQWPCYCGHRCGTNARASGH